MRYGLIGGKLGHSLSPLIHKLFFEHTGVKGEYDLLETEAAALEGLLKEARSAYRGVNVTIPHKIAVMQFLDTVAPEARAIGAVNTISFSSGGAAGYNTDYFGFGRMLEHNHISVKGRTVAVLGSGGAARAVVRYLADKEAAHIFLATRAPENVDAKLASWCLASGGRVMTYAELTSLRGDVIVNCTPVGMYPQTEASPVSAECAANFDAAADLIYNPKETLFLRYARESGRQAVNGLFMLAAQAVAAQEIWQGQRYDDELTARIVSDLEQKL